MTDTFVSAGVVSSGLTINSGDTVHVLNGGTIVTTTVNSGGAGFVSAGAVASTTTVETGATVYVDGLAVGTVLSGGTLALFNAATTSGTVVAQDGSEQVGLGTVASSTSIIGGNQSIAVGGMAVQTTVGNGGYELVDGVAVGATVLSGGTIAVFVGGSISGTTVSSGGTELLSSGSTASATSLLVGGSIDVATLTFAANGSAFVDPATDLLTVTEGGATYTQQLTGDYTADSFQVVHDAGSGTTVTANALPCFCRGTHILTIRGEVKVEALAIGDHVLTHSGHSRPIKWIGNRSYTSRLLATYPELLPIRFKAGSLGDGMPHRDLLVSRKHAMFIDGMLIPAGSLVNDASIRPAPLMDQLEYFHIELEVHDVLLAEGAPAESFVSESSREIFHNAAEYDDLYPTPDFEEPLMCAQRVEDGYHIEAIRQRLQPAASLA